MPEGRTWLPSSNVPLASVKPPVNSNVARITNFASANSARESPFYGQSPAKCIATSTAWNRAESRATGETGKQALPLSETEWPERRQSPFAKKSDDGGERAVRKRGHIFGRDFTRWRRSYRSRWDFIFDRVLIHPAGLARPLFADKSIRPTEITDSLR